MTDIKTAIGPVPTPVPPSGASYTPQLTGGQIYQDTTTPNWDNWNKGWNEGFNNAGKSYTGSDKDFGTGYLVGQKEYATRNKTATTKPTADNSLLKTTTETNPNPSPDNSGNNNADPEGDAKNKYKEITGEDPTADLLEKWKKSGQDLTKLAEENARLDMENADREYKATMDALGLQKGYVKSSGEKQRTRWNEREAELKGEADVQSEKDLAKVEKEKQSYEGEYEGDKSTLAQNWKDLSRYTQSLQRASGRQDSSFGNFAETKQLMDFNKGLRVLATEHSSVLGEFATAVTDTLDYYKQQKSEITRSVSDNLAKIDDWEQAQIVSIQGQEGISLAKKLSDINNATKQANNLKMQIQQNIDNKISTLDTWLLQTKVNFQDQVALLAKSASGAASSKDQAAALSTYLKNMKSSLDLGMSSYVTDPIVAGNVNKGEYLYDATTGKYIPVKGGTGKQYEQEKESGLNVAKTFLNNALGEI